MNQMRGDYTIIDITSTNFQGKWKSFTHINTRNLIFLDFTLEQIFLKKLTRPSNIANQSLLLTFALLCFTIKLPHDVSKTWLIPKFSSLSFSVCSQANNCALMRPAIWLAKIGQQKQLSYLSFLITERFLTSKEQRNIGRLLILSWELILENEVHLTAHKIMLK